MPTTVLHFETSQPNAPEQSDQDSDTAEETVKAAAENTKKTESQEGEPASVSVTVRKHSETPAEQAVTSEAKKGYDLLFVGIANMKSENDAFNPEIGRMAAAFNGPLAIVLGQGDHLKQPGESAFRILVPVTGTEVSRRAAEFAIALVRAGRGTVTALHVSNVTSDAGRRRRRGMRERSQEQAILKDIVQMADRYDVPIKTAVRSDVAPDKAILAEARKGRHDLIVMGVNRRSGDDLFFGDTAAAVFEKSNGSIVLLSGGNPN
jgi:nucleotide-binding universal stress UspA family protein